MNDYSGGEVETHAKASILKLRQIDVLIAHGRQVADAVRSLGVIEVHIIDGERSMAPDKRSAEAVEG